MQLNSLHKSHISAYLRLMRTDRPIGTLLLLWPTYWALWLANSGVPPLGLLVIFSCGVFIMRSAGCVINDFADRKVDGAVKRTSQRPLATGEVKPGEALSLFGLLIICAFALVLMLNWQTIYLSVGALMLAACYPFMKRYTHLPQVVLGMAYSFSIPMAFMASTEEVPNYAWLLFTANVLWTIAYDTMYAMVDRDDDLKIGVKSTAILFGRYDRHWIAVFNIMFLAILSYIGIVQSLQWPYFFGLSISSLLLMLLQRAIHKRERDSCFKAFLNNNRVGFTIFIAIAVSYLV
ncbi:4-hydroxybenzoate octaprenyltransferase [Pseudoalteromonas holothuriae]|uniref:4-hydroxybenzoate octaprenyltransferase n=1 Tax=Pseudoalteromonas holothuriae TaxID=2963714 RepID=A0A9W4QY97_9GAMM|nr:MULTISPECIES: 4-hydroxybenzoate octaprenyltransferase [unclassified Pseudoalteromonas]CAH9059339.1 4-hydroxybenzoate octaprenyltransferase [Pseudoalteromonas sp. CIP111854]CAH9067753.1 4-hydroxybenzoate octaprenyltransferase [Pseudoalteromonas sp. CIP111951]